MRYVLAITAILLASPALAKDPPARAQDPEIQIRQGFTKILRVPTYDTAHIGDPNLMDALPRGNRTLALNATSAGTTNLILLGHDQEIVFSAIVTIGTPDIGKVMVHNRKGLEKYYAHRCSPICVRVKDDLEGRDNVRESNTTSVTTWGPGGPASSSSINVATPP